MSQYGVKETKGGRKQITDWRTNLGDIRGIIEVLDQNKMGTGV